MDPILTATLCVGGIGLVAAGALALADKFISVREDPRIGEIAKALPGANCGGCGFAGCADYARAIVSDAAAPNLCSVGGSAAEAQIAALLGIEAGEARERRVAVVHCRGNCGEAVRRSAYNGIADCSADHATAGGDKGCAVGCLGLGTCARQCPVQAISLREGIAVVDKERCIGCGKCVAACPRRLIELVPASEDVHVFCGSQDKGPAVKKVCGKGCLGCTVCTKLSPGAFVMKGFLAVRDYTQPVKNPAVVDKCPGHCIGRDAAGA